MRSIYLALLLLLLLLSGACGRSAAPAEVTPGALLPAEAPSASTDGNVLVGVLLNGDPPRLVDVAAPDAAGAAAGSGLRVTGALPAEPVNWQLLAGREAVFAEVRGRLIQAPDGLELAAESVRVLTPQAVTLASLQATPQPRLVQMNAQLLAAGGAYLLVSELSSGGVPTASSLQFKLRYVGDAEVLRTALTDSGAVVYGAVETVALWRDGVLNGLMVIPRAER